MKTCVNLTGRKRHAVIPGSGILYSNKERKNFKSLGRGISDGSSISMSIARTTLTTRPDYIAISPSCQCT